MKTKLMLMVTLGALALGASVPNAMATATKSASARRVEAVRKSPSAKANSSIPKKAAVPSHTILSGAKN